MTTHHATVGCTAHPFASDWGATCILTTGHNGAHMFASAWAPDWHTQEVGDD